MSRFLIVGGELKYVESNFANKLVPFGVSMAWHWPWQMTQAKETLPDDCAGVIILKDLVSTNLATAVQELASGSKVPCAVVSRQFTSALPVLKSNGMIPDAKAKSSKATKKPEPIEESLILLAIESYLRSCKHHPPRQEILGHVKRQHGPHAEVTDAQVDQVRLLIQLEVSKEAELPPEPESAPVPEKAPKAPPVSDTSIEWASLVIEEMPERSDAEIIAKVQEHMGSKAPSTSTLSASVATARAALQAKWNRHSARKSATEREAFAKMKKDWLARYLAPIVESGRGFPSYEDIQNIARGVFGQGLSSTTVKSVKVLIEDKIKGSATPAKAAPTPAPTPAKAAKVNGPSKAHLTSVEKARRFWAKLSKGDQETVTSWVLSLDRDPRTSTTSPIRRILSTHNGKAQEFVAVILLSVPEGEVIIQNTLQNTYRMLFAKGLGPEVAPMIAGALGVDFRALSREEHILRNGGERLQESTRQKLAKKVSAQLGKDYTPPTVTPTPAPVVEVTPTPVVETTPAPAPVVEAAPTEGMVSKDEYDLLYGQMTGFRAQVGGLALAKKRNAEKIATLEGQVNDLRFSMTVKALLALLGPVMEKEGLSEVPANLLEAANLTGTLRVSTTHLVGPEGAACNGPNATRTTKTLGDVTCQTCKSTQFFATAKWVLENMG